MRQEGTIDYPPEVLWAATGFGAGIGEARELCGALAGAVMAIGLRQGGIDSGQGTTRAYWPAAYLISAFRERFGTTSCAALTARFAGFDTERRAYCARTVAGFCAARAQEVLEAWR